MSKRKDYGAYNQFARKGGKRAKYLGVNQKVNPKYMLKADVEKKYFTTQNTANFTTNAGSTTSWSGAVGMNATNTLFAPVFGPDITNRVGRKCVVHTIRLHYQLGYPVDVTNAVGTTPVFRIVLASFIGAKGLAPIPNQLMSANGIYAFRNIDYLDSWKILKDETISFPPGDTNEGAVPGSFNTEGHFENFTMNWTSKKGLSVQFTSTSNGDSGDIDNNNICLFAHCAGIDYNPRITWVCRIGFTDV